MPRHGTPIIFPLADPDADWMQGAACRGGDANDWFPEGTDREAQQAQHRAVKVCQGCEVVDACLDFAIANHINHGVWGGLTERGRRIEARRRRAR